MKTILATGADIKNRFLIARGGCLNFGPDIGDLSDAGNFEFFKKELEKCAKKIKPRIIAHDMHPGYFSTSFALDYSLRLNASAYAKASANKYSLLPVQHHHAHIASVIEEHGLKGPLIGVSFDGTGYGIDGNMWGGEFLLAEKKTFRRLAHLGYVKMPGGEKVISEPWRMVLSLLGREGLPFVRKAKGEEKEAVIYMCVKNINSPLTSSAGRLFDAAAALLGICEYASYEAEGPMGLERICDEGVGGSYGFKVSREGGEYIIDTKPVFCGMARDLEKSKSKPCIAAKFHNSMASIIVETLKRLSRDSGIRDIALSGGVFQNRRLREKTIKRLSGGKFKVFINEKTPVNDLNISLGQYHVSCSACKG